MSKEKARIAAVARFGHLNEEQIATIVDAGTHLTVPQHWALMMENTPSDKAYLILDGTVSIRHGKEEIAQLGAGDVIGEVGIVAHKLRTATVVSLTPLEVLHFTADELTALEEKIPDFRALLEATTAERLGK